MRLPPPREEESSYTLVLLTLLPNLSEYLLGADKEIPDGGVPRVIVYEYDGLPMQPVDPPSPDYVPGPEHPPYPNYVPGPEHPPSQPIIYHFPLLANASPVALSRGYVPDSDLEEDPEEDSEEEHADYPADGGDGDDEPSDDDTDDDDDDEEPFRGRGG
ncbi:hypothetical protein Tco_0564294 [Tanacetum coccineum]